MQFIRKASTKDTTKWKLRNVSCFNHLRALGDDYETDSQHIGTFIEEPKHPVQYPVYMQCIEWNVRVFKKAKRVLPLLKHVTYEVAYLDSESHAGLPSSYVDRKLHIVTVPTEGIPADEAITAIFLARDILNGHFRYKYATIFGGERQGPFYDKKEPPLPGFNPNKFWGNNKYFTAVVYFLLAFQPYLANSNNDGNFFDRTTVKRPNLNSEPTDGYYWSNNRTSLFSILAFAREGGYKFVQPPIKDQQGYIRDTAFLSLEEDDPVRQAVSGMKVFRKLWPGREAVESDNYLQKVNSRRKAKPAISNLLTVGEKREYFERGHRYAIENFISNFGTDQWGMSDKDVLDLLDHLVDILKNDQTA